MKKEQPINKASLDLNKAVSNMCKTVTNFKFPTLVPCGVLVPKQTKTMWEPFTVFQIWMIKRLAETTIFDAHHFIDMLKRDFIVDMWDDILIRWCVAASGLDVELSPDNIIIWGLYE